jgi:hypothetical protein
MLAVFAAADLAGSHLGWLQGNFFGGDAGPTEGDVCAGAQGPLEHAHFFTEAGRFGSHDEHGEQVDDGDYELVDEDTLGFPSHASEFGYDGDLVVDYEIDGDMVTFDVALPEVCADACADAYAWALSAFASGPWARSGEGPGRIVFQRARGGEVVGEVETDVYVVNADGSESDVELLFADGAPGRWSPDGSDVSVFCCDDGMAAHIVDVDTGDVRVREPPDPTLETFCAFWSPDGERLVCESYGMDDPSRNGIYSVRASDGGGLTRITSNPDGGDIPGDYSPDGTRLVFKRFEDDVPTGLFVVDIADDGAGEGEPQQLTPEGMVLDDTGHAGRWSPDGEEILFVARETEDHHKAIWVLNVGADGGAPRQLPIAPGCGGPLGQADAYGCYSPDWSPDGEKIAFTRSEPDGSNESIWIVNADGSGLVQVTNGADDNPDWGTPPSAT